MGTVFPLTSLKYFLDGLVSTDTKKDLNLIVAGRIAAEEEDILNSYADLRIRKLGYVPHSDAVQLAYRADGLLLTLSPIKGAERIIPAKIFEYLAAQKHIIAVVPDGQASSILNGLSGCHTVNPKDKADISSVWQNLLQKWKSRTLESITNDCLVHSRKRKTEELCAAFGAILDRSLKCRMASSMEETA
jgi:hypothetical protein